MAELFYPRGNGPLLSCLLPTRERTSCLWRAVKSVFDTVSDRKNVEVILRVDDDDETTIKTATELNEYYSGSVVALVGSRGLGWIDAPRYFMEMLQVARGDWLLLFNDDAYITTQNWDVNLNDVISPFWHCCPEDISVLIAQTGGSPTNNQSVIVRRKTCEILGYVAPTYCADNYLIGVAGFVHSALRLPNINLDHPRVEGAYDTRGSERPYWPGDGSYFSAGAILGAMADVSKLMSHITFKTAQLDWQPQPTKGDGWYCWQKDNKSGLRHCCVEGDFVVAVGPPGIEHNSLKAMPGLWAKR